MSSAHPRPTASAASAPFIGLLRCWQSGFTIGLALACHAVPAATVTLIPVADTSLLEVAPNNNLGGYSGVNAGVTQEFKRTRALFRFDFSPLPPGSIALSATLELHVTREPGVGEPSNNNAFSLHRMLRPWGEGDKSPFSQPGKGLPATEGEATWNHTFSATNAWDAPGGTAGTDFLLTESSFQFIYGVDQSPYQFDSTPELIADLNLWLQEPSLNHGWMLLCSDESVQSTARRFGSREDLNHQPRLELTYLVAPRLEIQATAPTTAQLTFTAAAGQAYEVLYRENLSNGTWQSLTNLTALPTNHLVTLSLVTSTPARLYRVLTQ